MCAGRVRVGPQHLLLQTHGWCRPGSRQPLLQRTNQGDDFDKIILFHFALFLPKPHIFLFNRFWLKNKTKQKRKEFTKEPKKQIASPSPAGDQGLFWPRSPPKIPSASPRRLATNCPPHRALEPCSSRRRSQLMRPRRFIHFFSSCFLSLCVCVCFKLIYLYIYLKKQ